MPSSEGVFIVGLATVLALLVAFALSVTALLGLVSGHLGIHEVQVAMGIVWLVLLTDSAYRYLRD